MAYIGKTPLVGDFKVVDNISVVNNQAAYNMQVAGVNVIPETAQNLIVSLNGVIQKPGSSFNVSSSTITFSQNLVTGDVIDFIQILGSVLDIGTPSDGTVTESKIGSGAVTSAKLSSGKILQIVQGNNTGVVSTTSTSFVDITSVTASITPISTSNKIMVIYSSDGFYPLVASTNVVYKHQVLRDSTALGERSVTAASSSGGLQARGSFSFTILDSPNTTSSVTYKAQHKISNSSSTAQASDASIVLMEVSA